MSVDTPMLPRKKQIRLPFQPSYLPKHANKSQPRCAICTKQQSKYFCPRCNIPYCSLPCYQNTSKHSQCSEPFYRQEIELEMKAERGEKGSKEVQEAKGKMWEMLKKFEEGIGGDTLEGLDGFDQESEGEVDDEEDDGLDELQALLEGSKLDNLSPEELLSLLPPSLRSEFISSISTNSNQPSAVIQTLLESEELSADAEAPWWMPVEGERVGKVEGDHEEEQGFLEGATARDKKKETHAVPDMLNGPIVKPTEAAAENLMYNILAITIAYIQISLVYRISPWTLPSTSLKSNQLDRKETSQQACEDLMKLVPFLEEAGSTLLLKSVEDAEVFVRSLADSNTTIPSSIAKAHLLPLLVPPPTIAVLSDINTTVDPSIPLVQPIHPLQRLLADVHRTLSQSLSSPSVHRSTVDRTYKASSLKSTSSTRKRAIKKLEFLVACVGVIPRTTWVRLGNEAGSFYSTKEREEAEEGEEVDKETNIWLIAQEDQVRDKQKEERLRERGMIESIDKDGEACIETLDDEQDEIADIAINERRGGRIPSGRVIEIG
ncbi:Predicted Zn-finger protein [Phaffia rhodozyma]|uniref:Predicted Zn-finger protein n=1 Tax=Phaffia rhodozyma TaxID=264483 RepID=A0A0F7SP30_PHARH|nr:Predicted Zn-finger protein [Phaffia rhodozyma]